MDALRPQIDALLRDARRAARPGAVGDDPDHAGAIFTQAIDASRSATVPSASRLAVAIDGPGLFVLEGRDGRRYYSRLGDFHVARGALVDGQGRSVLDTSSRSIWVGDATDVQISPDGAVSAQESGQRRTVAHIALAVFPVSQRLSRVDDTTLTDSPAAGRPRVFRPSSPNVGRLAPHALDDAAVALDADLMRAWHLSQQADSFAASTYADDDCQRTALGLVK